MIEITLDPTALVAQFQAYARQVPFATARALNAVAFDFQAAQQGALDTRFTLRRASWIKQGVYFPQQQRADYRVGRMSATVSLEPKRDFLAKYEQGGWKAPRAAKRLAVPIEAKRTKKDIVTAGDRIGALGLRVHGRGPAATVGRGLKRTWSIRYADGRGYIFRRVGRGKRSTVRLLYVLKPRVPIPAALGFAETAHAVARQRFVQRFDEAFAAAIATAR